MGIVISVSIIYNWFHGLTLFNFTQALLSHAYSFLVRCGLLEREQISSGDMTFDWGLYCQHEIVNMCYHLGIAGCDYRIYRDLE